MGQPSPERQGSQAGKMPLTRLFAAVVLNPFSPPKPPTMRDDYIKEALKVIPDPNLLINVVSRRVKQLRRGNRPLVESLEKLSSEDLALREIIDGKISFEAGEN
jgi:DNA-directed RNA polymerase subunit omega